MVVVLVEAMNAHTPSTQAAGVVWVVYTLAFIVVKLYPRAAALNLPLVGHGLID